MAVVLGQLSEVASLNTLRKVHFDKRANVSHLLARAFLCQCEVFSGRQINRLAIIDKVELINHDCG